MGGKRTLAWASCLSSNKGQLVAKLLCPQTQDETFPSGRKRRSPLQDLSFNIQRRLTLKLACPRTIEFAFRGKQNSVPHVGLGSDEYWL